MKRTAAPRRDGEEGWMWWSPAHDAVCRRHRELVAVYESPRGKVALLLQHTLTPSRAERVRWLAETRRAARTIASELKGVGTPGGISLLQWRPLPEVARIMRAWHCRYEGDPVRRVALSRLASAAVFDPAANELLGDSKSRDLVTSGVLGWYGDMTPSWLGIEPRTRRLLVLRTHRWIVERTLAPIASGEAPARDDLDPMGPLAAALAELVPQGHLDQWKEWIRLTVRDLGRALAWPAEARNDAWVRWLFLIPYSIRVSRSPGTLVPDAVTAAAQKLVAEPGRP